MKSSAWLRAMASGTTPDSFSVTSLIPVQPYNLADPPSVLINPSSSAAVASGELYSNAGVVTVNLDSPLKKNPRPERRLGPKRKFGFRISGLEVVSRNATIFLSRPERPGRSG